MKNILFTLSLIILGVSQCVQLSAQSEMPLIGQLPYDSLLNEIWGYYDAEQDKEYALVGVLHGTSIVDISTPSAPEELFFVEGVSSIWRDIKTYQHYAYTVTEGGGGMLITDLSNLPNSIDTTTFIADSLLSSAHNVYVDEETGYAFVAGFNNFWDSVPNEERGVMIFDLKDDPMNPTLVGTYNEAYVHDLVAQDGIMYTSEVYAGEMRIVDISDPTTPTTVTTWTTPSAFAHNGWPSDDNNYIFTTDEKKNGFVTSYDISDVSDVKELDRYSSSPGSEVIPHNAHYIDGHLAISFYRDGLRVVDASQPDALVETEYYDTSEFPPGNGFEGCWGAYPYLPSGLLLGSDRQEGLFIVQPDYHGASYLEGIVTDASTGFPIVNADVFIEGANAQDKTGFVGDYKFGIGTAGLYNVTAHRYAYVPQEVPGVFFSEGVVNTLDFALEPAVPFDLQVELVDAITGAPIADAQVFVNHSEGSYNFTSEASGVLTQEGVFNDYYTIQVYQWGHYPTRVEQVWASNDSPVITVAMQPGYYDDFSTNLEWFVSGTGEMIEAGEWDYTNVWPLGTMYGDFWCNPAFDSGADEGLGCYVTGNDSEDLEEGDVDLGSTRLMSPVMDLSTYESPVISYEVWICNSGEDGNADNIKSYLIEADGTEHELLTHRKGDFYSFSWVRQNMYLDSLAASPDLTNVRFVIEANSVLEEVYFEAGMDRFEVYEGPAVGIDDMLEAASTPFTINAYTSGTNELAIDVYGIPNSNNEMLSISIYDQLGRLVAQSKESASSQIRLNMPLHAMPQGVYFVQARMESEVAAVKWVR